MYTRGVHIHIEKRLTLNCRFFRCDEKSKRIDGELFCAHSTRTLYFVLAYSHSHSPLQHVHCIPFVVVVVVVEHKFIFIIIDLKDYSFETMYFVRSKNNLTHWLFRRCFMASIHTYTIEITGLLNAKKWNLQHARARTKIGCREKDINDIKTASQQIIINGKNRFHSLFFDFIFPIIHLV